MFILSSLVLNKYDLEILTNKYLVSLSKLDVFNLIINLIWGMLR